MARVLARRRSVAHTPAQVRSTLTASATKLTIDNAKIIEAQASKRQEWQDEAWSYFDDVGELKYSVWYMGNVMSKLRLYAAVRNSDDPDADPIPVGDADSGVSPQVAARCTAEIQRLRSPLGGRSEIVRELNMNLEIAAEAYLVGLGPVEHASDNGNVAQVTPESWDIKSVSEVNVVGGKYKISSRPNDKHPYDLDADRDTIIRIWQRHPRYSMLPDCNMRGVLSDCEALVLLANQVKAQAKSRMSAGYFTLPNELSTGGDVETDSEGEDDAGEDPLVQALYQGAVDPVEDPSSAAAVAPTFIRGPMEALKPDVLRHIPIHRESAATLQADITAAVERLARGMNLPVETVMGHQATTFANAEQVSNDEYEKHFRPRCVLICDALTVSFLQPNLLDAGMDADLVDRLCVWFDPAAMLREADPVESADKGHELGAISDEAWRRVRGWTEADAPEPLERIIRMVMHLRSFDPGVSTAILKLIGVPLDIPAELPSAGGAPAAGAASIEDTLASLVASARKKPTTNAGARLMAIDRELRTRLIDAADRSLARMLERAGNRLRARSKEVGTLARSTHPMYVAATLGPTLVAAAGFSDDDLVSGAGWDALQGQFTSWCADASRQALDIIETVAVVTPGARAQAELQYATDLADAWLWFRDALTALAQVRMYAPDPASPTAGEFDPNVRIPAGLVRQALARAGGASGITNVLRSAAGAPVNPDASGNDMFVAVNDGAPLGGVAAGETSMSVLDDGGAGIDAWQWEYGPAFRAHEFEPHALLDQEIFETFDDDLLAADDWIGAFYYPGDHDGCVCDVTPIIVPADFFGGDAEMASVSDITPVELNAAGHEVGSPADRIQAVTGTFGTQNTPAVIKGFDVLSSEMQDIVATRVESFAAEYPEAANTLANVMVNDLRGLSFTAGQAPEDVFAAVSGGGDGTFQTLYLNSTWFGNQAALEDAMARTMTERGVGLLNPATERFEVASIPWHPVDGVAGIVDHELGHVLDHASQITDSIMRDTLGSGSPAMVWGSRWNASRFGEYAMTNQKELFAEMFAVRMSPEGFAGIVARSPELAQVWENFAAMLGLAASAGSPHADDAGVVDEPPWLPPEIIEDMKRAGTWPTPTKE